MHKVQRGLYMHNWLFLRKFQCCCEVFKTDQTSKVKIRLLSYYVILILSVWLLGLR